MEKSRFELVEEGEWEEVVDFFGRVSSALERISPEDYARFEAWRPKKEENPQEMKDRTVEEESIGTTSMEKESEGTRTELTRAGGEMRDSGSELVRGHPRESVRKAGKAGNSTARGIVPMLARLVRGLERGIYRHVVEPTNPDYFESHNVSASIEKRILNGGMYRARIIFEEREMLSEMAEELGD